jgi:hypothetical protein
MAIFEWEGDPRTMNSAAVHNLTMAHKIRALKRCEFPGVRAFWPLRPLVEFHSGAARRDPPARVMPQNCPK